MAAVGDPGTWAVVNDAGGSKTSHIWGFGGKLGCMGSEWGHSDGSGSKFHHFWVVVHNAAAV
jgi:hypothetical protein